MHSPDREAERGVDPSGRKVREGTGYGCVRGHLADGAERGVGRRADEHVRKERAERASTAQGFTGTQEETSTKGTSDLLATMSVQTDGKEIERY